MNRTTRTIARILLEGGAPSPQQTGANDCSPSGFERGFKIDYLLAGSIPTLVCCGDGAPPSSTIFTQTTDFQTFVRSNPEKSERDGVFAVDMAKEKDRPSRLKRRRNNGGFSLVEVAIALFLLMSIAVFGLQTMVAGWMSENWAIVQSMTDSYAGMETAYAQRWTFASIATSGRWPVYPVSIPTSVTIGQTPSRPVTAQVIRTMHRYPSTGVDPITGSVSYLLESYVLYQDGRRQYCKVSKVYRDQ